MGEDMYRHPRPTREEPHAERDDLKASLFTIEASANRPVPGNFGVRRAIAQDIGAANAHSRWSQLEARVRCRSLRNPDGGSVRSAQAGPKTTPLSRRSRARIGPE